MEFEQWSDEQLLSAAQKYGEEARMWRNKFLGLLSEIQRRKLYEQKGFSSIFTFAFMVGGVSEEQVKNVLRIETRLQGTPVLHELFVSGQIGITKMERIISIATPENEAVLAHQAQLLSRRSLDTLVKDVKEAEEKSLAGQTFTLPTIPNTEQVPVQLDQELADRLQELTNKGFDVNKLLMELLDKRNQDIQEEKERLGESAPETDKRYVPQAVKDVLTKEHGIKCSIKTCTRPSEDIHHTQRFSLAQKHDPRYMAPLCREHHQIAHAKDVRVQEIKARARMREA